MISTEWLKQWIIGSNIIQKKFNSEFQQNNLKVPDNFNSLVSEFIGIDKLKELDTSLWFIYASLIHMNNNRLGLRTRDEPYIFYLLVKHLELGDVNV